MRATLFPVMSALPAMEWHQPVMGPDALRHLTPQQGSIIVDGTVGTGGHSLLIAPRLLPDGRLVAIDRDPTALALARTRLAEFEPLVTCVQANYRDLSRVLADLAIPRIDGLLLDLGMSSVQVDRSERGFSFSKEGPLDMRMDPEQAPTARALINELSADELATIFETFGEERFAHRIARRIIAARRVRPVTTTTALARLVSDAVPANARHGRIHPATRVFQALRIAVNDELGALQETLANVSDLLNPGGRVVILTFHSLEDRLVKRAFAEGMRLGVWTVLTKKPGRPSDEEVLRNPRARSAKLRAVERHHGVEC